MTGIVIVAFFLMVWVGAMVLVGAALKPSPIRGRIVLAALAVIVIACVLAWWGQGRTADRANAPQAGAEQACQLDPAGERCQQYRQMQAGLWPLTTGKPAPPPHRTVVVGLETETGHWLAQGDFN